MGSPPPATEESAWVARCKAGDAQAFEPLVLQNAGRIRRLVWGVLGSRREEAEDVVQEVFLKAYLALPKFKGESKFSTWLHRIAINHCRDVLRRSPPLPDTLDEERLAEVPADEPDGPEREAHDAEDQARRAQLQALLERLKEPHRAILVMREIEGLNYEEIGQIMGAPPGTVRSRLNRARASLLREAEKQAKEQS